MQIRKKKLPVEIIAPSVALRTPEFKQKFPMAKIPLLELDDGSYLPESIAIMEYLEDCFPEEPLRPTNSLELARMRAMFGLADTHLARPIAAMLFSLMKPDPNTDKTQLLSDMHTELDKLNRWFQADKKLDQRSLHLGDLSLAPHIWYALALGPIFDVSDILDGYDDIKNWWRLVNDDAAVYQALAEMETAFNVFASKLGK
jgi:glutathione S-transferase